MSPGLVDQIIHSGESIDTEELLKHLHPKVTTCTHPPCRRALICAHSCLLHSQVLLGIPLLEGTNPASCFPRFAIGYEATCYSYIWSEVCAPGFPSFSTKGNIFFFFIKAALGLNFSWRYSGVCCGYICLKVPR